VLFRHFLASKMVRLYVVSYFIVTRSDICAVSLGCLRAAGPIGLSWRRTLQFFFTYFILLQFKPVFNCILAFFFSLSGKVRQLSSPVSQILSIAPTWLPSETLDCFRISFACRFFLFWLLLLDFSFDAVCYQLLNAR